MTEMRLCPLDCRCQESFDELERLRSALAVMWHAYVTDNRPPHQVAKIARECYELGKPHAGALEVMR